MPTCLRQIEDSRLYGFEATEYMLQWKQCKDSLNKAQFYDGFKKKFSSQSTGEHLEYALFLEHVFLHSLETVNGELDVDLRKEATEMNITVPASWSEPTRANLCALSTGSSEAVVCQTGL
jgi:hypothetical protein